MNNEVAIDGFTTTQSVSVANHLHSLGFIPYIPTSAYKELRPIIPFTRPYSITTIKDGLNKDGVIALKEFKSFSVIVSKNVRPSIGDGLIIGKYKADKDMCAWYFGGYPLQEQDLLKICGLSQHN